MSQISLSSSITSHALRVGAASSFVAAGMESSLGSMFGGSKQDRKEIGNYLP
jgi:hypothetical protein